MCFCLSLQVTAQEACRKPSIKLVLGVDISKAQKGLSGPGSWTGGTGVPDRAQAEGSGGQQGGFWEETRGQPPPQRHVHSPEPGAGLPLSYAMPAVRGRTHPPRPNHTVKTESLTFFFPSSPAVSVSSWPRCWGPGQRPGRAARGGCVFQGPGPKGEPSRIWSGDAPGETPPGRAL